MQTTRHERSVFWTDESYAADSKNTGEYLAEHFLEEPPADVRILLGYVKDREHYQWIHREALYNLRADGRTGSVEINAEELSSRYLLLYGNGTEKPDSGQSKDILEC